MAKIKPRPELDGKKIKNRFFLKKNQREYWGTKSPDGHDFISRTRNAPPGRKSGQEQRFFSQNVLSQETKRQHSLARILH